MYVRDDGTYEHFVIVVLMLEMKHREIRTSFLAFLAKVPGSSCCIRRLGRALPSNIPLPNWLGIMSFFPLPDACGFAYLLRPSGILLSKYLYVVCVLLCLWHL